VQLHLRNDSESFHPVHPLIRAFGPRVLHQGKGRGLRICDQAKGKRLEFRQTAFNTKALYYREVAMNELDFTLRRRRRLQPKAAPAPKIGRGPATEADGVTGERKEVAISKSEPTKLMLVRSSGENPGLKKLYRPTFLGPPTIKPIPEYRLSK
jgi:hypothetical protein